VLHPRPTAGAFTLEQAHILPAQGPQGLVRTPASEEQLWSYLVQLASGLRCIHSAGLAARPACLQPSKVLLCGAGRVRIGSLGLPEVLAEAPGFQDVAQVGVGMGVGCGGCWVGHQESEVRGIGFSRVRSGKQGVVSK
jgi:hypothetical protein